MQGPSLTWDRCTIEYSVVDSLSGGVDTEHWGGDSSDGGGARKLPLYLTLSFQDCETSYPPPLLDISLLSLTSF